MKDFFISIFVLGFITLVAFLGISNFGFDQTKQLSAVSSSEFLTIGDMRGQLSDLELPEISEEDIGHIQAEGFLSVYFTKNDKKILAERNADEKFGIASITKLISIITFFDNFNDDLERDVGISAKAVGIVGPYTGIDEAEKFKIIDLVKASLIASSNQAVFSLAEYLGGEEKFVQMMNDKAAELDLENTFFFNSTGLDSVSNENFNFSTPSDLVELGGIVFREYSLISDTSIQKTFDLYTASGDLKHSMENTNSILFDDNLSSKILMSKTGQTPKTGQNLLIVTEGFVPGDYIVSAFLNSPDRFADASGFLNILYNN